MVLSDKLWSTTTSSGPQVSAMSQFPGGPCLFATSTAPPAVSAGLAVDYFNERLYWADAKLSVIGSVRLDGSDPVIAVSGVKNS